MQRGERSSGRCSSTNSNGDDEPPNGLASKSKRERALGLSTWLLFSSPLGNYGSILSAVVLFFSKPGIFCDVGGGS